VLAGAVMAIAGCFRASACPPPYPYQVESRPAWLSLLH